MAGLSSTQLGIIAIVVLFALGVAWWIMRRRPERVRTQTADVLTPGAAPAARNALLVEAAPAVVLAAVVPVAGDGPGGVGESVAPAAIGAAEPGGEADDLTRIKGLGPKIAAVLAGLGVTRFGQIAGWDEADVARIDPQLGIFQGRIARDAWIEQARHLAAGDLAGFEARFGKV